MQYAEIVFKIQEIWSVLKTLKAPEVEQHIVISKNIVEGIIGGNEIQKIRNSSLLKLFLYELIIFASQIYTEQQLKRNNKTKRSSIGTKGNLQKQVRQLKEVLVNIYQNNEESLEIIIRSTKLKAIIKKVNQIQEEVNQSREKKKYQNLENDAEGMQAMVEQLEELLKKKENRIKELNNELQQNFNDKQELENEINQCQMKNLYLQQSIKTLQNEVNRLQEEFQSYKKIEKEQIALRASQFMNQKLQKKLQRVQSTTDDLRLKDNVQHNLETSTRILAKYCSPLQEGDKFTMANGDATNDKTVKKHQGNILNQHLNIDEEYEENLLESLRIFRKSATDLQTFEINHELQLIILTQAQFIEKNIFKLGKVDDYGNF